jgi:hypothetical protein
MVEHAVVVVGIPRRVLEAAIVHRVLEAAIAHRVLEAAIVHRVQEVALVHTVERPDLAAALIGIVHMFGRWVKVRMTVENLQMSCYDHTHRYTLVIFAG